MAKAEHPPEIPRASTNTSTKSPLRFSRFAVSGMAFTVFIYLFGGSRFNSIISCNSAPSGSNWWGGSFVRCCTLPGADGVITNEPRFVNQADNDFHLQATSLCINAGSNAYAPSAFDLDGNPRIVGGTGDIGAFEFQAWACSDDGSGQGNCPARRLSATQSRWQTWPAGMCRRAPQ